MLLMDSGLKGLEPSISISKVEDRVSSTRSLYQQDCSWTVAWTGWIPVTGTFQNPQSDKLSRLIFRSSGLHLREARVGSQTTLVSTGGMRVYIPITQHIGGHDLPDSLVYGVNDRTKAKWGCSWDLRGVELFLGQGQQVNCLDAGMLFQNCSH